MRILICNIPVNQHITETAGRVFIVTEHVVSGTQCTDLMAQFAITFSGSRPKQSAQDIVCILNDHIYYCRRLSSQLKV